MSVIKQNKGSDIVELDESLCPLIADLEHIIGSACYNPSSYDGNTGEEGCSYKYPVFIPTKPYATKTRRNLNSAMRGKLSPGDVWSMRYKFGANHLYIGQALVKALQYLEDRYDINFKELEQGIKEGR